MAQFSDLAVEIQEMIWKLALAQHGHGRMHWVQIEGVPRGRDAIAEKVQGTDWDAYDRKGEEQEDSEDADFFSTIYLAPPSVWGSSQPGAVAGAGAAGAGAAAEADEVADTRRCRQLSGYAQLAALRSTCRLSRFLAEQQEQQASMNRPLRLYRSMGPTARPRALRHWLGSPDASNEPKPSDAPHDDDEHAHTSAGPGPPSRAQNGETDNSTAPQPPAQPPAQSPTPDWTPLRIDLRTDLLVLRLHTAAGDATPTLQHGHQLRSARAATAHIPAAVRIGLEWHDSWAAGGGAGLGRFAQRLVRGLLGQHGLLGPSPYLHFLVDGVPRPRAGEGVLAGEVRRVLERDADHRVLRRGAGLRPDHPLLDDGFEACGRRYFVVGAVCNQLFWPHERFFGPEETWHVRVREVMRFLYELEEADGGDMWLGVPPLYPILSWEPI